jgi:putative membrane protein
MLTRLLVNVVALLVVFYFVWNIHSGFLVAAVIMAVILALVNAILRPILVILTLPVTILSLGLFIIVINILLFALSVGILNALGYHFDISFGRIVLGYLIYVIVSAVLTAIVK